MGVFRLVVENIVAAHEAQCGRGTKVPSIPLGLFRKNMGADPD
jgi:hypothetical protein